MKKAYILYNKMFKRKLNHPRYGLWCSEDLKEAQEMLKSCHEYLNAIGAEEYHDQFVIMDAETDEIIAI